MREALFTHWIVINGLGSLENPNWSAVPSQLIAAQPYECRAGQVDARALRDARTSGLTALNLTLGHFAGEAEPFITTVRDIAAWDAFIRTHAGDLRKVYCVADISASKAAGQIGVIYGLQNTTALCADLDRIAILADLGVRVIQLTYNTRNAIGDGALVCDDGGLTEFGAAAVNKLQEERVLVDLSHSSTKTCLDTLALARRPVVISHSACRTVADHPRNKSDAELRLLAERGGVIGIYFMPYLRLEGQPYAADLIAHLEHAINICGEDHVGIGTDGSITAIDDMTAYRRMLQADIDRRRAIGVGAPGESADICLHLPDLCGVEQFRRLAGLLEARGHSDSRIEKILGGNFARAMSEAWA